MNRRGLHNDGANLGESTSCLLTFQHDMLDQDIDNDFCKMSLANGAKPRPSSAYRARDEEVAETAYSKSRSSSAYRVRGDESVQKSSCKPRSSSAHRFRQSDRHEPLPRNKSGSENGSTETTSARSKSNTASCNNYNDNDSTSTTSVTSVTEYTINPRSDSTVNAAESKPKEYHRPRPPTGRSRPVIRTHRSGSFALRQFKENYDQTHNGRSKTKAEARSRDSMTNETMKAPPTIDAVSENYTEWVKPPLRPYRSVDGSFRLQGDAKSLYSSGDAANEASDVSSPFSSGSDTQSKEFNGGIKFTRTVVEVAPGCSMLMCGIDETMSALHLDRIIHAECTSCNTFLACINVASMVLCPGCQTVSPLESSSHSYDCIPIMGLGLRVEDILAHSATK